MTKLKCGLRWKNIFNRFYEHLPVHINMFNITLKLRKYNKQPDKNRVQIFEEGPHLYLFIHLSVVDVVVNNDMHFILFLVI